MLAGLVYVGATVVKTTAQQAPAPRNPNGWDLPAEADQEKNPLAGDAKAVADGKVLFEKNCKRCHGPGGKGDGPDADPDSQQDMKREVIRSVAARSGSWRRRA